jgi:hypothetical protein
MGKTLGALVTRAEEWCIEAESAEACGATESPHRIVAVIAV